MIDSVVLELSSSQYTVMPGNKLYTKRDNGGKGYSASSLTCGEYLTLQKKRGIYFPLISIHKKRSGLGDQKETVQIQVSLPKLILGTNLFEIDERDLDKVFRRLKACLTEVGVQTDEDLLRQAIVRRVDFSKVIRIPTYFGRANQVVHTLSGFNYKASSDFKKTEYSNGGEGISLKFWNSTKGYVIYDKFGEITLNAFTEVEKSIVETVNSNPSKRSALRFELSLQRKPSLEAVVWRRLRIGKKKDFTLEEVMNQDLAKGLLLDNFEEVFGSAKVGILALSELAERDLYAYLNGSGIQQKQQERLFYWVRMATISGIAETWRELDRGYRGGSIGRVKRDVALAITEVGQLPGKLPNLVSFLREEHEKFEIIRSST